MRLIAGVDIGGTTIKIGLFEQGGELLCKWEVKTPGREEAEKLYPVIAEAILEKVGELGFEKEDLKAVGMGLPGPIREDGYLPWQVNLGQPASYPGKELEAILHVPCVAGNDANVAALGEAKYGAAKGYKNVVMVTLGTGVGGGIIVNGKIVAGNHGVGGEIGHFVVNPFETEKCNCGNKGCLEQYSSATGIVRNAKKILATGRASVLQGVEFTGAKTVNDAAIAGDSVALEALDVFGRYLGMAISHLILTTDPDRVVLGGGVSRSGEIVLNPVLRYVDDFTHIAEKKADIVLASLGNDGGIFGARALAEDALGD